MINLNKGGATVSKDCLASRNWQLVLEEFQASSPYNYAVMDDFLDPSVCEQLHQELLHHQGWRSQSSTGQPLISNMAPDIKTVLAIAEAIKASFPIIFSDYELVEHWALMYPKNASGKVHSDIGSVTVNLWLTPKQYNLDASGGGLLFFDVKRESDSSSYDSLAYLWSEEYVQERTKGQTVSVSYQYNRALLFDARTFHKTDNFKFANTAPESYRMNLSLAFENPAVHRDRSIALRKAMTDKSKE